jgi:hypothetical protein
MRCIDPVYPRARAGLFGEFLPRNQVLLPGVQRAQQGHRETTGRTQTRAGRDVGHADDFQVRLRANVDHTQGFAYNRVLHLVHGLDQFHLRILHQQFLAERLVQRDVDVFVDGRGDDEAGVFAVVRWQVRAAAAERNAQWSAGDDHRPFSW